MRSEASDKVEMILRRARAFLQSHGGDVELLGVSREGVALVRFKGACAGCRSADVTLQEKVEKVLLEQIPELKRVEALL